MRKRPKTEAVEQAREVLLQMDEKQEIEAVLEAQNASIKKHEDQE